MLAAGYSGSEYTMKCPWQMQVQQQACSAHRSSLTGTRGSKPAGLDPSQLECVYSPTLPWCYYEGLAPHLHSSKSEMTGLQHPSTAPHQQQ